MYFDPTYILVLIGFVICVMADGYVKNTYRKYEGHVSMSNLTGAEVAEVILKANGITDVRIGHVGGTLSDHYSPSAKVINLSDSVYSSSSVSAVAVAAHECGHVLQYYKGYLPMKLRSLILPIANIGSRIGIPMVIIGIILGGAYKYSSGGIGMYDTTGNIGSILCTVGIWVFAAAVAFQIITLPVEFNASRRGLQELEDLNVLKGVELNYGQSVLKAAAMTYVAGAASSILQLLRLVILAGGGKKRR